MPSHSPSPARRGCWSLTVLAASALKLAAAVFPDGENVRLTRGEMVVFQGKDLAGAAKGQEFTVLKHGTGEGVVHVVWYRDDGSRIAVALPATALELSPPDAWSDLLRGVGAFRERRYEESRRMLARAARDPKHGAIASVLATRITGALNAASASGAGQAAGRQAGVTTVQALRDTALQLTKLGHLSLALWLDQGTDALATALAGAPATKLDRPALEPRVAQAEQARYRARQAIGLHRLTAASQAIQAGLEAEPGRIDLVALRERMARDLAYAEESYEAADRMRRFEKGAIHALSAIERGLKACADHPRLRALKKEMQSAFEERTSPPVTSALVAAARAGNQTSLAEGHRLYTARCTECHDLELLESRHLEGWERTVGGMARRAGLSSAEQARILEYLAAARTFVLARDDP